MEEPRPQMPSIGIYHFDLSGLLALVTGSSSGLGLVIARGLAEAGASVVLNGRDETRLVSARDALREDGLDVQARRFDVTDEADVAEGIAAIRAYGGPIDILVNNAGVQKRAPLESFSAAEFESVLSVHLTGAFLVARNVVSEMKKRRRGKIINICSLMSEVGRATIAPYTAAKGGLKMLTRAMAVEWASFDIQVNGIGPGYFVTEMTRSLADDPDFDAWVRKRTPAGRWGDPSELIGAAVFLASRASSFVNGQILYVDGGMLAGL